MQVFQHIVARDDVKGLWRKSHISYIACLYLAAGVLARPLRYFCTQFNTSYFPFATFDTRKKAARIATNIKNCTFGFLSFDNSQQASPSQGVAFAGAADCLIIGGIVERQ